MFQAWRTNRVTDEIAILRPWMRLADSAIALHSWQFHRLCAEVTHAVRQDDKHFYEELASEQGAIAADEGLSGLWRKDQTPTPQRGCKVRKANIRCTGPQVDDLAAHYAQL